jgi:tRNA modification GTPase
MSDHSPTRVTVLTPAGRGAIASIAVHGPRATAIVDAHFKPASQRQLGAQPCDRILYGRWAKTGEEVVVVRRNDCLVEIHCHGGPAASQAIVSSLTGASCQRETWEDFVTGQEKSPIRAAAHIALARCSTERTAAILLDQYHGALESALRHVQQQLADGAVAAAIAQLRELHSWADFGRHLTTPWRVAIAGPPNAGKSTLLNALAGYERAIVFDQPGTTRDVVTASTAFDGWPFELADTAGIRSGGDELERMGIARATSEMRTADLVILVFDLTEPWTTDNGRLVEATSRGLIVYNKTDLLAADPAHASRLGDRPAGIAASAKTGIGIDRLLAAIVHEIVPRVPARGAAIPFAGEHVEKIAAAIDLAERGNLTEAAAMLARLVVLPAQR